MRRSASTTGWPSAIAPISRRWPPPGSRRPRHGASRRSLARRAGGLPWPGSAAGARADAVFCSTDVLAVGVLMECLRQGVAVPGELAVAGFDDLPIAAEIVPALTTVRVPRRRMGEVAAGLILQRLAGEPMLQPIVDVGFEPQVRASA
ncbi:MAG: substrate-binding domain-containing protein [Geminicoccaceae bacterium]